MKKKYKLPYDRNGNYDYKADLIQRGYTFRPTTDQWYPNFEGELVAICCSGQLKSKRWSIEVTGADDFAMSWEGETRMQALDMFKSLPAIITQSDLKERGFKAQ